MRLDYKIIIYSFIFFPLFFRVGIFSKYIQSIFSRFFDQFWFFASQRCYVSCTNIDFTLTLLLSVFDSTKCANLASCRPLTSCMTVDESIASRLLMLYVLFPYLFRVEPDRSTGTMVRLTTRRSHVSTVPRPGFRDRPRYLTSGQDTKTLCCVNHERFAEAR
jgi:hypothetical protein